MISIDAALAIVEKLLHKANATDSTDLQIDVDNIGETTNHWLIGYNSAKYLATKDAQYAVMGNSAYAILKTTGKIDHDYRSDISEIGL